MPSRPGRPPHSSRRLRLVGLSLCGLFVLVGQAAAQQPAPPPAAPPATPTEPPPRLSPAAERQKAVWLQSTFRCRAVSTTRMRPCQFSQTAEGYALKFEHGIECADVVFDDTGNPRELRGCRSGWLRIPRNNRLTRAKKQPLWTRSRSGWFWRSDGEPYCCPGMWLEAPQGPTDLPPPSAPREKPADR